MAQFKPYSMEGLTIGKTLSLTRQQCLELVNGQGNSPYQTTAQCILTKLTAFELAIVSSRQYILTLWPAFVGVICALGPAPSNMVYDNVWWAILFSMTCAGLPGVSSAKPPHHVTASSISQGRAICEDRPPVKGFIREVSRSWALAHTPPEQTLVVMEWICFLIGILMYLAFSFWFAYTLRDAFVIASEPESQYWLAVAAWYWLSPVPALSAIVLSEAWQHRVELFEPDKVNSSTSIPHSEPQKSGFVSSAVPPAAFAPGTTSLPVTLDNTDISAVAYRRVDTPTIFHVWSRVIIHQWKRQCYRLLIKPSSNHPYFFVVRLMVGLGRISIFVWGSAWMGDILLMPMPQDLLLLVLLLFTSALPRIVFPRLWPNGTRGADLVVRVSQAGTIDD